MRKILFIVTTYRGGGVETSLNYCIDAVFDYDASIEQFVYMIDRPEKTECLNQKASVVKRAELRKWFHKQKDVLVINYNGDWKSSLLSRLLHKEYISWVHSNPYVMRSARTALLNFYLLKRSKRIVYVCKEQQEIFQKEMKFCCAGSVIYNCVDIDRVRRLSQKASDMKEPYLLMAARMDLGSKDFETLIKAYGMLPEGVRSANKLVLLGDGRDFLRVRQLAVLHGVERDVVFPGYAKNPYPWMKNAKISLLISKNEGFGLVPIEAMACQTPLIISDYKTGAAEVSCCGNNCAITEEGNAAALRDCILRLLSDEEERDRLIRNASSFVEQFSYDAYKSSICRLLDDLKK